MNKKSSPISQSAVVWGDLDIVKLSGHVFKKRKIPQLGIQWYLVLGASIFAILVIGVQLFVPFFIQEKVGAAMFCGDIIRQINQNRSEPEKFFVLDGKDTIQMYQDKWLEYARQAEEEINQEKDAKVLAYDPVCAAQDIQIDYYLDKECSQPDTLATQKTFLVGRGTDENNCYDLNGVYSLLLTCNNNTATQIVTYGDKMCQEQFSDYKAKISEAENERKIKEKAALMAE